MTTIASLPLITTASYLAIDRFRPRSDADRVEQSIRGWVSAEESVNVERVHCDELRDAVFSCEVKKEFRRPFHCRGRVTEPTGAMEQAARLRCSRSLTG